ncbi:MAG: TIGR03905 family TSCPD domain-containing protein [Clostridia bacterium]|nr:TIGR03905 family TSCPD domain-containing protein [Clostridia bacterium]
MKSFTYRTRGTCSREIQFEIDGNTVKNVCFVMGCQGNTTGVARLVEGMDVNEAISRLEGIDCGGRGTSCPDQLAQALKAAKEQI